MPDLDAPSLLIRLIDTTERVLNRATVLLGAEFDELEIALNAARLKLAAGRIVGDEAIMLATTLRNIERLHAGDTTPWRMIAGALLPLVRRALGRSIEDRHTMAARPDPEAQPSYGGSRPR